MIMTLFPVSNALAGGSGAGNHEGCGWEREYLQADAGQRTRYLRWRQQIELTSPTEKCPEGKPLLAVPESLRADLEFLGADGRPLQPSDFCGDYDEEYFSLIALFNENLSNPQFEYLLDQIVRAGSGPIRIQLEKNLIPNGERVRKKANQKFEMGWYDPETDVLHWSAAFLESFGPRYLSSARGPFIHELGHVYSRRLLGKYLPEKKGWHARGLTDPYRVFIEAISHVISFQFSLGVFENCHIDLWNMHSLYFQNGRSPYLKDRWYLDDPNSARPHAVKLSHEGYATSMLFQIMKARAGADQPETAESTNRWRALVEGLRIGADELRREIADPAEHELLVWTWIKNADTRLGSHELERAYERKFLYDGDFRQDLSVGLDVGTTFRDGEVMDYLIQPWLAKKLELNEHPPTADEEY
jgi:hypothetical protein